MYIFEERDKIARKVADLLCENLNLIIVSLNLFNESISVGIRTDLCYTVYIIRYHEYNICIESEEFQMLQNRTSIRSQKCNTTLSTKELFIEYENDKLFALETVNDLSAVKSLLQAVPVEVLCEFFEIKL